MGLETEIIGPEEIRKLSPITNTDGVLGALYDPLDGLQDGYLVPARYIDTDTGVAPSPQLVGKKIRRLY